MKTNCIQIKIGNEVIKFSGVEVDSTSDLNQVLKQINTTIYKKDLDDLNKQLSNIDKLKILKDSDVTRIADYKVGNTSLFTLQSILLNKGSKYNKPITKLIDILSINGINIKTGNVLITNTSTPQLYIGEYRNLLELPDSNLEENLLAGMTALFVDHQLNNVRSTLFNAIKIKYNEYIDYNLKNNMQSNFIKDLETLPDDINKIKRFFYSVPNKNDQNFDKDIQNAINEYNPSIKINSEFYFKNEEDYLYHPTHIYDEIELENKQKVSLETLLKVTNQLQKPISIEEKSMSKNTNKDFIIKLKDDLSNLYDDISLWKFDNLKQLTSSQYQLKWITDHFTDNLEYEKIYNFLLTKYFKNEKDGWIKTELTERIRSQYENIDPSVKIPDFRYIDVFYDNNVIFKPSNKITFREFKFKESNNKVGSDKFNPNERTAHVTGAFINNLFGTSKINDVKTVNEKLKIEFDKLKNTKVTTLTFPDAVFYNHNFLIVLESALANGFNIELSNNKWIYNKKAYTRNEFLNEFYSALEKIQGNKYESFKTSVYKPFYDTSKIKLKITDKTQEIITNDVDLINQDLNSLVILSNKTNDFNFKIIEKEKLSSKEANLYSKSTEKTILHEFKSKKSFYKLTITPIENKYKIEKANIVSDNFNGANLLNNIIRDMKLNVYTYSNAEENAERGYVKDGNIYINISNGKGLNSTTLIHDNKGLNSTTLIHEMSHLLFAGMKSLNKDVYINLINNINDLIKEGNKDIINKWNTIINHPVYENLSKYDQIEELIVKLFSETLTNKINNITDDIDFGNIVSEMFKLDDKLDNSKIVNKTIASLMATYGSNYNNLFNSMFPMSDHLNELKLAEYKEMLIRDGKLTEKCD